MSRAEEKIAPIRVRQQIKWLPGDMDTPISLYMKKIGDNFGILLESAEVDGRWGRYSILATDFCFFISCEEGKLHLKIEDSRFQTLIALNNLPFVEGLRKLLQAVEIDLADGQIAMPSISRALYGYLGFGMISVFNPHLQRSIPLSEAECCLGLPATVLIFDHLYNRLCQLSLGEHSTLADLPPLSDKFTVQWERHTSTPSEEGYKNFVRSIRNDLYQGEAIQVVPSTRFSVPFSGNPFSVYRRLRRFNASPYMFYMKFPHITLLGSSPEVMVSCTENNLLLAPIAGTRKRGMTDSEDAALAAELLNDPKDKAEHVMLVDLGRNDLGRLAEPGTVRLEKFMEVERFSHVMHLTSRVSAKLAKNDAAGVTQDALSILAAAFPAGTVSGAPKMAALEIIRKLEGQSRGPYAGCIGWIGLDKDTVNMDMGITIRSMWVKDGEMHWQAGGGIVHDSDPDMEWQEVINKSAIIRTVLQAGEERNVPFNR